VSVAIPIISPPTSVLQPIPTLLHLRLYLLITTLLTSSFFLNFSFSPLIFSLLFQSELSHLDSKTARDIRNLPPISPPVRTFTSQTVLTKNFLWIYHSFTSSQNLLFLFLLENDLSNLTLKINLKS
jgi:hypothetical protein